MFWKVKDIYRRDEGRLVGQSKGKVVGAPINDYYAVCKRRGRTQGLGDDDGRNDNARSTATASVQWCCMFVSFSLENNATVVSNYFQLSTTQHFLGRSRSTRINYFVWISCRLQFTVLK